MVKRSKRSSHRRTKRRSVRSTRSRRHHRARHTRGRGKRYGGTLFSKGTFADNVVNQSGNVTSQPNSTNNSNKNESYQDMVDRLGFHT